MSCEHALNGLTSCGCCRGTAAETPERIWNRPGLRAIVYRVGTQARFKESLLARLSTSGLGALQGLRTRADADFAIALLDAFATTADVLTFYQERIANESYLRTATERRSLLELARLIGYELNPGLAATTWLAFNIEDAPGGFGRALSVANSTATAPEVPPTVTIPVGLKVQSIPAPGEKPQIFETVEAIPARAEWNEMRPQLTRLQTLDVNMPAVYLAGVANDVKKGDRILISANGARALRRVAAVELQAQAARTLVTFEPPPAPILPGPPPPAPPPDQGIVVEFARLGPLTGNVGRAIAAKSWSESDLHFLALKNGWDAYQLAIAIAGGTAPTPPPPDEGLFIFRDHAAIFGYNAPPVDPTKTTGSNASTWENRTIEDDAAPSGNTRRIWLDRVYPAVVAKTWIVLEAPGDTQAILSIDRVDELAHTAVFVSAKVTRITVTTGALSNFKMRETVALVQSEKLKQGEAPIDDPVANPIDLDRRVQFLHKGQHIIVTGAPVDLPNAIVSESATLDEPAVIDGRTVLALTANLKKAYVRGSVTINANVAFATHGESVSEVLGGGDATKPFLAFPLRQPPLTYVPAETESGSKPELEVRVNGVRWDAVPSLFDHDPNERIYTIRNDDDGNTFIRFGDGATGARVPTGDANVTAAYRRGIGLPGRLKANQLSQLMSKPAGVKGVTNPLDTANAAAPETLQSARTNASLTALTLGRVVSLRDYEDYARAFRPVAKAHAEWGWSGERRHIVVTIAIDGGAPINDDLPERLLTAIHKVGNPHVALSVVPYDPLWFRLKARVKTDEALIRDDVFDKVRAKLSDAFSFDARDFGQPVSKAEVLAVMHSVPGVIAVDIDEFYSNEGSPSDDVPRIGAQPAVAGGPARLLILDPTAPVRLEAM